MLVLLLAVLLLLSTGAAHPTASVQVLQRLDELECRDPETAHDADYTQFIKAICDSYNVDDVYSLRDRIDVAVIYYDLREHKTKFFDANLIGGSHAAASTTKTVLLCRAALQVQSGSSSWNEKVGDHTLGGHARRMISVSSNSSANALLDYYGIANINAWLASLGFATDDIHFARQFKGDPGVADYEKDNTATAAGLAKLYFLLAIDQELDGWLAPWMRNKVMSLLNSSGDCNNLERFNNRLNGGLDKSVSFSHKTGANSAIVGDGGVIQRDNGVYVIVAYDAGKDYAAMRRLGANLVMFADQCSN